MSILESVNNVADSATKIARLIAMVIIAGMMIFGATTYYAAQNAVEEIGERAERVNSEAVEAARAEIRNAQLAEEGWGYDAADERSSRFADKPSKRDNDWGENTAR